MGGIFGSGLGSNGVLSLNGLTGALSLTSTGNTVSITPSGTTIDLEVAATSPGGSSGQLQYNNAGAFGGASAAFYDNVNNRLGIGTTTPRRILDVLDSSGSPQIRLTQTDNSVFTDLKTDSGNNFITALNGSGAAEWTFNGAAVQLIANSSSLRYSCTGFSTQLRGIISDSYINGSSAVGAQLNLRKSNTFTIGGNGQVASGGQLGTVTMSGNDGSAFQVSSAVTGEAEGTISSGIVPGRLKFNTANSSGTLTEAARIDSAQNIVLGTAALSTSATNGFTYLTTSAGVPTGVPATTYTGLAPMLWDSTDNALYFYSGGVWNNASTLTSVSNSDGTLTISPTTGAVVASLALGHANTWTGQQTFNTSAPIFGTMTQGSVLFAGSGGLLSQNNTNLFWDNTNLFLGVGQGTPAAVVDILGTTPSTNVAAPKVLNVLGAVGFTSSSGGNAGSPISLQTGDGGANTSALAAAGIGGTFTLITGAGGTNAASSGGHGGDILYTTGAGGSTPAATGGRGGNWTITLGAGATGPGSGGLGGSFSLTAGTGGAASGSGAAGGAIALISGTGSGGAGPGVGGNFTMTSGTGGGSTNSGGRGGIFNMAGGTGGTSSNTALGGGNGGNFNLTGGTGGANSSTGLGGNGASAIFAGGNGGTSVSGTGGSGGTVFLNPGSPGVGGAGNGANGYVALATNTSGGALLGRGVSIGGLNPTAYLHILTGGTASASTAPIKLTSGTSLTSPEAGAIEFTTDDLFFTITTGPARKGFIFNNGAKLTSGLVPVATTNGRLIDGVATSTELSYLSGVTSAIQTQLNAKGNAPVTADLTAQTASISSVVAVTTPNDGNNHQYQVGAYSAITAISAGTLTVQVTFTDENGTSQTLSFFPMGITTAGLSSTGFTGFTAANIRCQPNTAVTLKTTFTGVSISYDIGGNITRIN